MRIQLISSTVSGIFFHNIFNFVSKNLDIIKQTRFSAPTGIFRQTSIDPNCRHLSVSYWLAAVTGMVTPVGFWLQRTPTFLGDHVHTGEWRRVFLIYNFITAFVLQFLKRTINEEIDILREGGGGGKARRPYL